MTHSWTNNIIQMMWHRHASVVAGDEDDLREAPILVEFSLATSP